MEKNLQSSWLEVAKTNVFNHSLRVEVPKKPHESTTVTYKPQITCEVAMKHHEFNHKCKKPKTMINH
jgi:hypothetical protein